MSYAVPVPVAAPEPSMAEEPAQRGDTLTLPAFQRHLLEVASPAGPAADEGAALAAPEPSMAEEPAQPGETRILPAFQRHLLQVASPAGPAADDGAGRMAGAIRRLMLTPWFAAATGFVVAAGLLIYSPHPELKFPPAAVGGVRCQSQGCVSTAPSQGALATSGGRATPSANSAKKLSAGRHTSRFKFGYRVLRQLDGNFAVMISVSGRHIPRTWELTFGLPGDTITRVEGAAWRPSGAEGGTASWPATGPRWQPTGLPGATSDQHDGTPWNEPGDSFLVIGTGTPPAAPVACSFGGHSCKFS